MTQAQEPVTISISANAGQRDFIDQAADRLRRTLKASAPWETKPDKAAASGRRVK
jgi:hypothetical protein